MSVMENKIAVLKETPNCPNLRTLFLSRNKLKAISGGFFEFIPHLSVLDLSTSYELRALPKGISELISLECLDLSWTGIEELPIELKSIWAYRKDYPNEDNVLNGCNEKLIEELKGLQRLNRLRIPIKSMFLLKLKSIYWDALPFPCFKLIHILKCQELKKLPLNSNSAKGNQLSIEGSKDWWATVEWENKATRDVFLPSFKIMGNCCSVQCGFENFLLRGWDFFVGHANYVCQLKQTLPSLSAALQNLTH
ncbi:hypothetical protein Gohar_003408 [Gossypium harknessii]|uniref:Uncharacterized protein n=1 Tax=Gossypium harknessii TaxID=34285 RepID=A0A7J9HNW7_9ROSI|nr:hypothetical protein [Gossypium harknessii]